MSGKIVIGRSRASWPRRLWWWVKERCGFDSRPRILRRAEIAGHPVIFSCGHAEAHRVDDRVLIELQSATSNMRMIWAVNAREALNLAHQIENAFHQWSEDQPEKKP